MFTSCNCLNDEMCEWMHNIKAQTGYTQLPLFFIERYEEGGLLLKCNKVGGILIDVWGTLTGVFTSLLGS